MDLYATRGVTLTTVVVDWPLLSPNTASVPRYTLLLLLLHAIAVSLFGSKKKKKEKGKIIALVFFMLL